MKSVMVDYHPSKKNPIPTTETGPPTGRKHLDGGYNSKIIMKEIIDWIRNWYQGAAYNISTKNFPVFPGIRYRRHWTSSLAHTLVDFYLKEWKWIWGFLVATVSASTAILKLFFNN